MKLLEAVGILSLCLYGVLGLGCLISFLYSLKKKHDEKYAIQQVFHFFLSLFIAVRISWFTLRNFFGRNLVAFALNRFGFLLFFTAFTVVLFYWAETYHKTYVSSSGFLPRLVKLFVTTNLLLYAYEVTLVILFVVQTDQNHYVEEGNLVYEFSIMSEVFVSFIVSVGFLIYGARLFMSHGKATDFEENFHQKAQEILRILISTIIFSVCFLVRVIAFLYRPITNGYMNDQLFQVLGYFIPELIPSIVQFYIIQAHKKKQQQDNKYIEGLYKQEEDIYQEEAYEVPPSVVTEKPINNLEKSHLLE